MSAAPRPISLPSRPAPSNGGDGPARGRRGDHVGVGRAASATGLAAAGDPRDQVEPLPGRGRPAPHSTPARARYVGEQLGGGGLVAGRVRGVEPDQRLRQPDDLFARAQDRLITRAGASRAPPRSGRPPASAVAALGRPRRDQAVVDGLVSRLPGGGEERVELAVGSPARAGREREADLARALRRVGAGPGQTEQRAQREAPQLGRATAARRWRRPRCRSPRRGRPRAGLEAVPSRSRCSRSPKLQSSSTPTWYSPTDREAVPMPPGNPKHIIPVPAPTVPSATSSPRPPGPARRRRPSPCASRPAAVVALADHRQHESSGPRPDASTAACRTVPTACVPQR